MTHEADRALGRRLLTTSEAVGAAAALVRFSALGGSTVLPLVGVASASGGVTAEAVVLATAIGVGFHGFAYVLNDVVDLPVDRTDPRRANSPLVTGLVGPRAALLLAGAWLAIAVLAAAQGGPAPLAALAAAAVGLGAYDMAGKRTRWPAAADAVQALGWGSLVLAGVWLAGDPTPLSLLLAAYVVAFILMANGIHGALRDLPNDTRHGVRTTAAALGATIARDGRRVVPRLVILYAGALQAALVALTVVAVVTAGGSPLALGPSVAAPLLLAAAVRASSDDEILGLGMLHLLAALAVPVALVASSPPPLVALLVAVYAIPLLTHGWLPGAVGWGARAASGAGRYARDLALLARPHNALAAGAAVVVGAHLGGRADLAAVPVLGAALVAALVVAAVNVANDRADVAEDRINRPSRPLAAGRVTSAAAARYAAALGGLGLVVAGTLGLAAVVAAGATAAVGVAYVTRLKGVPVVGHLLVAALSASTIPYGALVLAGPAPEVAIGSVLVFLSVLSSELLKAVGDRDGDRAAGRATLATRLPVRASLRVHAGVVGVLIGAVLVAAVARGAGGERFVAAAMAGIVVPQLVVLARLRAVERPADVRPVLRLTKVAWLTGLVALAFLV